MVSVSREFRRTIISSNRIIFLLTFIFVLLLQSLFFVFIQNDITLKKVSGAFKVVLLLNEGVLQNTVLKIENQLKSYSEIKSVKYISKNESAEIIKKYDPRLTDYLEILGENPLPSFFEFVPQNYILDKLDSWNKKNLLTNFKNSFEVNYNKTQLREIIKLNLYKNFLLTAAAVLTFLMIFFIISVEVQCFKTVNKSTKKTYNWLTSASLGIFLASSAVWVWGLFFNDLNFLWKSGEFLAIFAVIILFAAMFARGLFKWQNIQR